MSIPRSVRELVQARAQATCERCGRSDALRWSIHHRRPRGMGGSKDPVLNSPANLILLCGSGTDGCHGWVETNRSVSYTDGLLVHRWDDPEQIPVALRYGTVLLDAVGGVQSC